MMIPQLPRKQQPNLRHPLQRHRRSSKCRLDSEILLLLQTFLLLKNNNNNRNIKRNNNSNNNSKFTTIIIIITHFLNLILSNLFLIKTNNNSISNRNFPFQPSINRTTQMSFRLFSFLNANSLRWTMTMTTQKRMFLSLLLQVNNNNSSSSSNNNNNNNSRINNNKFLSTPIPTPSVLTQWLT